MTKLAVLVRGVREQDRKLICDIKSICTHYELTFGQMDQSIHDMTKGIRNLGIDRPALIKDCDRRS